MNLFYEIDSALTDDERNTKTSHLSELIHEEERKRESYRVSFVNFFLHSMKSFVLNRLKIYVEDIIDCHLLLN